MKTSLIDLPDWDPAALAGLGVAVTRVEADSRREGEHGLRARRRGQVERHHLLDESRHAEQVRQESTMQPTPASSPARSFVTSAPTRATLPTISWPGTNG